MASQWRWRLPSDLVGKRADKEILRALTSEDGSWEGPVVSCSRSFLQRLIEDRHVLADGKPIAVSTKLKPETLVEIFFPIAKQISLIPENRLLEILFEDEHLVVVNKPAGLTVHPSETQKDGTLVHALLHHIKDLSGIGGELRPGIVHRIDKHTSGSLVITKTDVAHRALAELFSKHEIEREYWAFCYGSPKKASGKIETLIGRNPNDRKKMSSRVKEGRKAVTQYSVKESYGQPGKSAFASWIVARLETGRTHQVRVHLTDLGNSILGDPVYGVTTENQPKWKALPVDIRDAARALPGQALHARLLAFEHPVTKQLLRFEAEPPAAVQALMKLLEKYS
jgi:23S rRNA pseudouridine1911/1915/1917 synthase